MAKKNKDLIDQKKLDDLNKKYKSNLKILTKEKEISYLSTGIDDLNEVLSGDRENGGWPRGRIVELFGPEGSGKTWILSQTYKYCTENGLKALHYDAEGSYSKAFAASHGVDLERLIISDEDVCEKMAREIYQFLEEDLFDVIGIDSLASLVPERSLNQTVGAESVANLPLAMSRIIPMLNSALKKSNTVLIFVNQLRDDVGAKSFGYTKPEKTPGGRTVKFNASVRLDVRARKMPKSDRPDMFDSDNNRIGHVLKIKTQKNKVYIPFKTCEADLMYKIDRPIIRMIKEAIETDVLERQRNKNGDLWGKKLYYHDVEISPDVKYDYEEILGMLRKEGLVCDLVADMLSDDMLYEFVESGDVTEEEVQNYIERKIKEDAEKIEEIK